MKSSFTFAAIYFLLLLFISQPANAQKVGTGLGNHFLVINSSGRVYSWGSNEYGQLGNGNTGTNSNVPVAVSTSGVLSGKTITQVVTGFLLIVLY